MSSIRVTPEQLEQQSRLLISGSSQVNEIITTLMTQVTDLAGGWEGAGSAAFQRLFDEWRQGAAMTREGMEGLGKFLAQAAVAYRDTDTTVGSAG